MNIYFSLGHNLDNCVNISNHLFTMYTQMLNILHVLCSFIIIIIIIIIKYHLVKYTHAFVMYTCIIINVSKKWLCEENIRTLRMDPNYIHVMTKTCKIQCTMYTCTCSTYMYYGFDILWYMYVLLSLMEHENNHNIFPDNAWNKINYNNCFLWQNANKDITLYNALVFYQL